MFGKCIYCGQELELSKEHYLPRCLGNFRGYETLDDKICGTCNNSFKQIEEQFCRSSPEGFFRERLEIKGRKRGKKISPFQRGSAGAPPLMMKGKFPGEDFEILWQFNPGTRGVDHMRQIILFTENGDTRIILIPDDMKDPSQLREKIKEVGEELGVERFKEARIFAPESEIAWINYLLSHLQRDSEIEWSRSPEKGRISTATTVTVTSKYFRALAKIGFHYFLKRMPKFHGSEDTFADIKNFIKQGGIDDVDNVVSGSLDQISTEITRGMRPVHYCHLLATGVNDQWLISKLQFFLGPDFLAPIYVIKLGENPSPIWYQEVHSDAFIYYENREQDGYDGYLSTGTPV